MLAVEMTDPKRDDGGQDRALAEHWPAILEALHLAKIGVCVTTIEAGVSRNVVVSDVAVEILGHPREALLSGSAFDFIVPSERERLRERRDRRLSGEALDPVIDTVIVGADGTERPITFVLTDVSIDGAPARVSLFWDISARRDAEIALRSKEARLRRLFESAPDGIVVSREGVVLEANPAAANMLGFAAAEEMIGTSLRAVLSPVDRTVMAQRVAAAREGQRLAPHVYEARRRDGARITAEITSVPYEHDGKPAVMGFARDVTERLRLQEQLMQSERLAALGTLAAGVAHEINNPLTVMVLGIQALDARLKRALARTQPEEQRDLSELISELRDSVDRVAGIVGELRTFGRSDEHPPRPTDIAAVLASAERLAAHRIRPGAEVWPRYDRIPLVMGHARRLEQVFVNLLFNAAQAMPEGRPGNRIDLRASVAEDGRVVIEVTDNGTGMPSEVRSRAFDPFFTTKVVGEGTGLGLSISHGIVTRLGGEITIESEVGKGTTVRVHLLAATAGETALAPETSRRRPLPRLRMLVIDDEPALVSSLRALLTDEHEIVTAVTGSDACVLLDQGPAFDVVLCDLMMPGMTGMDVHARMTDTRPEVLPRFLFMTGEAFTPRATQFVASVPNKVLRKPFSIEELMTALGDLVAS